ncbi:MAG: YceI family protein [Chloroflexi bacterium]|nr:YceI family protein [Chloroflexota bacterium]
MTWKIDNSHTSIEFSVRHMIVAKVKGRFGKVSGTIDLDEEDPTRSSIEVEVDIASLDTREQQRDAHLLSADFLEVEKYPTMTYRSHRIERHGDGYRVVGDLTIKGVTREVVLDAEFSGVATDPYGLVRAGFSAETAIDRKDFGLEWNVALEAGGVLVGDKVNISLDVEAIKETESLVAESKAA